MSLSNGIHLADQPASAVPQIPPAVAVETLDLAGLTVLRARLSLLRRLAWLQHLWGGRICSDEWGWQIDHPDHDAAERVWSETSDETARLRDILGRCDTALVGENGQSRMRLARLFNLSSAETDALDLAFALHEEPSLWPLVNAITPHRRRAIVDEPLIRHVFLHARAGAPVWRPGSGLSVWGLLKEQGEAGLAIDPAIASFLKGSLSLDPLLVSYARLAEAPWSLDYWQTGAQAEHLDRVIRTGRPLRCIVTARRGDKPLSFAAQLCRELGIRLLAVSIPAGADATTQAQIAIRAERLALLGNFAISWQGFDWRFHPASLSAVPLQFHFATDGDLPPPLSGTDRLDWVIDLPPPPRADRETFCRQLLKRQRGMVPLGDADLAAIAASNAASLDDLESSIGRAPADLQEALSYLDETLVRPDEDMTGRISVPRRDWSEIVLPETTLQTLQDVVYEATARRELAGRGGGAVSGGMPVLLHGTPGTGKTLAAEIIAAQMGCNLYTVDVASIVSKYVGETAKNLRRIFFEARSSGNVIFFDEADTFFVKRTEVRGANDKHANADTNYLLQLIEAHPGTTILATNRRADIDPAFFRRMRYIIELARPAAEQRLALWQHCLERLSLDPRQLPEGFLPALSHSVELSPAQIGNSALTGFFMMRQAETRLSPAILLKALSRELTKEGRALGRRDLERMARYG